MPSCSRPASLRCLPSRRMPPARYMSGAMNRPPGFRSVRIGVLAEILSNSSSVSGTPASRAIASKMQHGVRRAAGRSHRRNGVLQRRVRDDLLRANVVLQKLHHELAAIEGDLRFSRIDGGNFVGAHRRNAEKRDRRGHGVGGELAAARARAGARVVFEFANFFFGHFAGRAGADGLEHVLNRDVVSRKRPGMIEPP